MKKSYIKPITKVFSIDTVDVIAQSSQVGNLSGNTDTGFTGGFESATLRGSSWSDYEN